MDNAFNITCPCCNTILVVDRVKGKILEQRKPIIEESTGDRFEDAFEKVRGAKDAAEQKFMKARERERGNKERLESLFKESLKRVEESGDVGPMTRDIDLD